MRLDAGCYLVCNGTMNKTKGSDPKRFWGLTPIFLLLAGCAGLPTPPDSAAIPERVNTELGTAPELDSEPVVCPAPELTLKPTAPAAAPQKHAVLKPSHFSALPQWSKGVTAQSWTAFLQSCQALSAQPVWAHVCGKAVAMPANPNAAHLRAFFEAEFTPWQIQSGAGSNVGLVTGYYEPLLRGSRTRTAAYPFPIYGPPADLLTVDLGDVVPELKGRRLRGRLQGNRVVAYLSRADIDLEDPPLQGRELVWVDDAVDLFFLQIQGSGRIALEDGTQMRVGYADKNGYPFRSIGRVLVDRGDLTLSQASLSGIKGWVHDHPDQMHALLNANPSYVFFRQLPDDLPGPLGALGVPLTAEGSIAVDPRVTPLGAPVFLDTTVPNSKTPLRRLMMAQDTGGAIYGPIRADFFWGFGDEAGKKAGSMKQAGRMWLLYPKGQTPPTPGV